jgi:PKD repeat protein
MIPFLIEPHNPWDNTPKKKKHLCQQIEEDALMARIIAEQQASAQQIQNQANAAAGAGGVPPYDYFHISEEVADYSYSPLSAAGPVTIVFTNLTPSPEYDTYSWNFGDTSSLSYDVSPTHFYLNTGSFSASMVATYKDGTTDTVTKVISSSRPVVTALFSTTSIDTYGPVTISFTGLATNTSYQPTSSYYWNFGDGTTSSLGNVSSDHIYPNTQSYTASFTATGSYGITSVFTRSFYLARPTMSVVISASHNSPIAPSVVTLSSSFGYNGHGDIAGTWYDGEFATGGAAYAYTYPPAIIGPSAFNTASSTGPNGRFSASLHITESSYNITASARVNFLISPPNVTASFTYNTASGNGVTADGFTASFTSSVTWVSSSYNPGILRGTWIFGDSTTLPYTHSLTAFTHIYITGSYTSSLSVTESKYNFTSSLFTASFSRSQA